MIKKNATKRTPRVKTPKVRNAGTMTESQFWSFIRSALRNKSRFWKPVSQCKANGKRDYKDQINVKNLNISVTIVKIGMLKKTLILIISFPQAV